MTTDVHAALRQFGEEAGLSGLTFGARGQAVLQAASGRQFGVELAGREVLAHVSQPLDYDASDWLLRAFRRAHYARLDGDWPVQAALREQGGRQRLLALTRIAEGEFTARRLRQAFDDLSRWLDAVRDDSPLE